MNETDVRNQLPRTTFVTHAAVASGAELRLLNLLAQPELAHGRILFLDDGPLVDRARSEGVVVEVLPMFHELLRVRREATLTTVLSGSGAAARAMPHLARALRDTELVVAWSQKAMPLCVLATIGRGKPLVWALNDILSAEHFTRLLRQGAVRLANAAVARVVANSIETRAAFLASGGDAARVAVVEPGIPLQRFATPMTPTAPLPPRRCAFCIVQVGRLAPWKGQVILLRAVAELVDVEVWLVGDALFGEADYVRKLEEEIEALGLYGRAYLLRNRNDVPALLQTADLFVHAATSPEPFGQVVVEAMAAGLPVIVSEVGAPPRLALPDAGLGFKPGDVEGLRSAIMRLTTDATLRMCLGAAGKRRAVGYSIERSAQNWRAQLEDVSAGRPSSQLN